MGGRGNTESIREAVSSFKGTVPKAYVTILELKDELGFDLDFNFNAANGLQRFTTMVRNLIQREVIDRPIKSGRSSILNETTLLQILVSRKYLNEGCGMESLAGYLTQLSLEELYARLFARQLPDIDTVAGRSGRSSSTSFDSDQSAYNSFDSSPAGRNELYRYIKIGAGMYLHIQEGRYSLGEIEEIKETVKTKQAEITRARKKTE